MKEFPIYDSMQNGDIYLVINNTLVYTANTTTEPLKKKKLLKRLNQIF